MNSCNSTNHIYSPPGQPCRLQLTVITILVLHLALWTLSAALSHKAPDWDNMEELVWAGSLEWGYYKHPPLPTWLLYGLLQIFDRSVWITFFAGQLSVVLSLWMIWKLGCEFTSQKRALVAMLLVSVVAYFTVRGVMNNHNTMQLWSIVGAIWMFYRATRYESYRAWAVFGFFCGCAFLTKYSALIQFATFALYLLVTGQLKRSSTWKGIALAGLIVLIMVLPHLYWLTQQVSGPVAYADNAMRPLVTYLDSVKDISDFLLTNIGRVLPLVLAAGAVYGWTKYSAKKRNPRVIPTNIATELAKSDRLFILLTGIAPLALTIIIAGVLKVPLMAHWATTFFVLFGFLTLWVLPATGDNGLVKKTIAVVLLMQIIGAIGYGYARGPLADKVGRPSRATFPGAEVSRLVHDEWKKNVSIPLSVVASDTWLGGNIVTHLSREAKVLIDGDYAASPWIDEQSAKRCGMLIAINKSERSPDKVDPRITALMEKVSVRGEVSTPWTSKKNGPVVSVEWGIILPQDSCLNEVRSKS
ncbi:glycosyltransferase family 39 protein [Herminiimonas contaminans]|uniref:Glycosyltransferase family 39 protein n=1 Tax=Herminiimonas contaminans TaxID=1111140 RepID=A0ABS0EXX1_9BURK|nr:glycosyltransferase family 39 protein [Herminiimonas contaminans]